MLKNTFIKLRFRRRIYIELWRLGLDFTKMSSQDQKQEDIGYKYG
jgi:hypothetical protein